MQNSSPSAVSQLADAIDSQRALAVDFQSPTANPAQSPQNKTLLVTGGASGFGEQFVTTFTKSPGCAAIIADLDSTKGEELEKNLRNAGHTVKFIQVDVTSWDSVINLFRNALTWLKELGSDRTIDHVICSAGVESGELDIDPVHPDDFLQGRSPTEAPRSRSIQISILGSLHTVTAAMRYGMGLHQSGSDFGDKSITLIASLAGYAGMSLRSDYTASKWGVRGLFRSLLDDRTSDASPVRINLIAPYFVATPLTAHRVPELQKLGIRMAEIDDVRDAALRLICDDSIHGRAVGILEGGPFDLRDDYGGGFGFDALREGIESGALVQSKSFVSKQRQG